MSVIDAKEFAKRRKQKKIDKEQTEDDIYQEKVADLVENMLVNAVFNVKQDDIHLEHFLMEVWMQSNFIALRFFQDKTFNELLVEEFGDCDGVVNYQDENSLIAGLILKGENSANSFSDYVLGPSHILPTNSSSRFSSPLSVEDFIVSYSYVSLDRERNIKKFNDYIDHTSKIAKAEGLTAHAIAAEKRLKG